MENLKDLREKFGSISKNGKEYVFTQHAYLDGLTKETTYYIANAIGADDGEEYAIEWEILEDYDPACQDESLACDWDNPSGITRIRDVTRIYGRSRVYYTSRISENNYGL